jgi:hypothetical protein
MSWNIKFVAKTKEAAVAKIRTQTVPHGLPLDIATAINERIQGLHLPVDRAIIVETNGHFDPHTGGNAHILVNSYGEIAD